MEKRIEYLNFCEDLAEKAAFLCELLQTYTAYSKNKDIEPGLALLHDILQQLANE